MAERAMSPEAERLVSSMAPRGGLYSSAPGYRGGDVPAFRVGNSIRPDVPYRVQDPSIISNLNTPMPQRYTPNYDARYTSTPSAYRGGEVSDVGMGPRASMSTSNYATPYTDYGRVQEIQRVFNSPGRLVAYNNEQRRDSGAVYSTPMPTRRAGETIYSTGGPDPRPDLPPPHIGAGFYVSSRNGPANLYQSGGGFFGGEWDDSRFAHSGTGRIYTRHPTDPELVGGMSPPVVARAAYRYAHEYMDAPMGASLDPWARRPNPMAGRDPRLRYQAETWTDSLAARSSQPVMDFASPYLGNSYYPPSLAYRFEPTFQSEPKMSPYIRELLSRAPPVYEGEYEGGPPRPSASVDANTNANMDSQNIPSVGAGGALGGGGLRANSSNMPPSSVGSVRTRTD